MRFCFHVKKSLSTKTLRKKTFCLRKVDFEIGLFGQKRGKWTRPILKSADNTQKYNKGAYRSRACCDRKLRARVKSVALHSTIDVVFETV